MNGTIADSIIIRVGHGIMSIPRKTNNMKNTGTSVGEKESSKESMKEN